MSGGAARRHRPRARFHFSDNVVTGSIGDNNINYGAVIGDSIGQNFSGRRGNARMVNHAAVIGGAIGQNFGGSHGNLHVINHGAVIGGEISQNFGDTLPLTAIASARQGSAGRTAHIGAMFNQQFQDGAVAFNVGGDVKESKLTLRVGEQLREVIIPDDADVIRVARDGAATVLESMSAEVRVSPVRPIVIVINADVKQLALETQGHFKVPVVAVITGSVNGPVTTQAGDVEVNGALTGNITTSSGYVVVNNKMRGDVSTASGDVTMQGSVVARTVSSMSGNITVEQDLTADRVTSISGNVNVRQMRM